MSMQNNDVTTGRDLNDYTGNANLAGGSVDSTLGPLKVDLSPLEAVAVRQYEVNKINYQQDIKDRDKISDMYMDPTVYANVDESLANQIAPKLDRFKELAKAQIKGGSKEWYEFQRLYTEIQQDNAKAKTVQQLKDQYKKASGESVDEHEKESMMGYVNKLDNYKLGDDIPVYNKYFKLDVAHLPAGDKKTFQYKRLNGNYDETVESTINNPLHLDKKAYEDRLLKPEVANTGIDIGHTLVNHDPRAVDDLNDAALKYADQGRRLNIDQLRAKYKNEFAEYQKAASTQPQDGITGPPSPPTFQQFLEASPERKAELKDIDDGLQYLKEGVQLIPTDADQGRKFTNYSYTPDGKFRLSVDNDKLRAIYGATREPIGRTEKVVKSELTTKAADIDKINAGIANDNALTAAKIKESKAKIGAINALTGERNAKAEFTNKKTAAIDDQFNPMQTFDELFKGKIESVKTNAGNNIARVKRADMPKAFLDNLGIDPINSVGDYNVVPSNVQYKGKQIPEADIQKMYAEWLKSPDAAKLQDKIKKKPDIFDFIYTDPDTKFEVQIVGKIAPIYKKQKNPETGEMENVLQNPNEAGQITRSNRMQSWINQRKQLGVKGTSLLMEDGVEGSGDINNE